MKENKEVKNSLKVSASVPLKVKFETLGCRVNQYETQAVREKFLKAHYKETQDSKEADLLVLNTCTVTKESDRESRYLIRKFHRENPNAKIIVTGCYVEKNRKEVESIPGVSLTVLNQEKSEIVRLFESCASFLSLESGPISKRQFSPLSISEFEGRTRAYVKIEDGCNHACSFCKVVLVRGPARSRSTEDVIEEAKRLSEGGYPEIVLTGIQLGAFGFDQGKQKKLPELLVQLEKIETIKRIRLSSIEPTDVTTDLIDLMEQFPKICPHLHIPLQSGSDFILERMNRRYRSDFFEGLINDINRRINHFVLTTDVMVGFPGETKSHFEETLNILRKTKPYKLHIFPYSPREGTRAANQFSDLVLSHEVKTRMNALGRLESELRRCVIEKYLNQEIEILIEDSSNETNWIRGRASNFIAARFPLSAGANIKHGSFQKIKIEQINEPDLIGKPL